MKDDAAPARTRRLPKVAFVAIGLACAGVAAALVMFRAPGLWGWAAVFVALVAVMALSKAVFDGRAERLGER